MQEAEHTVPRRSLLTRRRVFHLGMILFLVLAVAVIIQLWPKRLSYEVEGIKYQLGAGNEANTKPLKVRVEGYLHKNIKGERTFKGTIDLEGENVPVPEESRKLSISFPDGNDGQITYHTVESGVLRMYSVGTVYINRDMSRMTIGLYQEDKHDASRKSWSGSDGMMISAPADSRENALALSNELMKRLLLKPLD
jgi:hypothetical protein